MNIRSGIRLGLATVILTCCLGVRQAMATSVNVQPSLPSPAFVGSNQTFIALTSVTPGDIVTGYSWRFYTNNPASFQTIFSSATTNTFVLSNIQTNNQGFYFVSVTYNSGATTNLTAVSTAVFLTVHDQARITSQPVASQIRATGTSVSFNVTALGQEPLAYQWRINGTNLADNGRITGSATNSLAITGLLVSDTGNYDVVVSNTFASVTSQVSSLTVYIPPFVVTQPPTNLTVVTGSNAVFNVAPGGSTPFTFQWQKDGNFLSDGGRISGSTSNILTIANALTNDNGVYTLFFSNPIGSTNSVPVTLTVLIPPAITSTTNAHGQQGFAFNYQTTATGTTPITFGATNLPTGLGIDPNSGLISGIPQVFGTFNITLSASNAAAIATTNLHLLLLSDIPGITSSTNANGKQGTVFKYTIKASNSPVFISAIGLPPGINLTPGTNIITGPPIVSGLFPVLISVGNQFGTNSLTLFLNIASDVPVITSPLNASGTENDTNFTYTITASNTPTSFGAIGLPSGLNINTNTGVISGTLLYGGTNFFTVTAANAYGVGSTNVELDVAYETFAALSITNVTNVYSSPYLLDFTFTLQDDQGRALARPPEQLQVVCEEGDTNNIGGSGVPIPNETTYIVNRLINGTTSAKMLKTVFAMDYTYSMFITPGAIDAMQGSVENLIGQEPPSAQFGVVEFNADDEAPQVVSGFTSDRTALTTNIQGIQTNFVMGDYAGTRLYDALALSISQFSGTNSDEERFVIVLTDGYDDSSVLNTSSNAPTLPDVIVQLALSNNVQIYVVGFGPNPDTNDLEQLTSQTQGRYYAAGTTADLASQFALLLKDLNSQYILRWATLQRNTTKAFQPMFLVGLDGITNGYNTNIVQLMTNIVTTNTDPTTMSNTFTTNLLVSNITELPMYNPGTYAGDVRVGALTLVPDASSNISSVTLRTTYMPRFIREFHFHYRPNFPVTPSLLSTGPGDVLNGWSLSQTNDGSNGYFLTIISPDTSNVLSSLPYGIRADLANFQFQYQAVPVEQVAFSQFDVDNTIYSNIPPSGQSFTLSNNVLFVTNLPPTPPLGTPIPWLESFGFTTNFASVETNDFNGTGLMVWQDYIAGLDPTDPTSTFVVFPVNPPSTNGPPVIMFNTALGRTYRVDSTTTIPGPWSTLQDNIAGTGGLMSIPDNRNLAGINSLFYRVVVSY